MSWCQAGAWRWGVGQPGTAAAQRNKIDVHYGTAKSFAVNGWLASALPEVGAGRSTQHGIDVYVFTLITGA
jgi:hypothetical protein